MSTATSNPPSGRPSARRVSQLAEDVASDDSFVFSNDRHGAQEFRHFRDSLVILGMKSLIPDEDFEEEESAEKEPIKTFEMGKRQSYDDLFQEINRIQESYADKGMKEWQFASGILHCLAIAYVFGALPGHFWVLYLFESTYWMTWKFFQMWNAKPMCEIFYYFDFCWMMNVTGVVLFALFCILGKQSTWMDSSMRQGLLAAAFGLANGPILLAAVGLPFVAVLFHDVNTMANLIIHILPAMLLHILYWNPDSMREAYPSIFLLDYDTFDDFSDIARRATRMYLMWWIPYVAWMLVVGMNLPSKSNYDTVFHSLWRGGPSILVGKALWKRPSAVSREQSETNQFEVRDFLVYIVGHLMACVGIGVHVFARLCHAGGPVGHGVLIALAVAICARRGGQRYSYYTTVMYGQRIQKYFQKLEQQEEELKEKKN